MCDDKVACCKPRSMKGTSPIAAKKGESAASSGKKFKGLLCFDGECEFWSAASALQNNALNAFSHLQYGNVEDLFSLRAKTGHNLLHWIKVGSFSHLLFNRNHKKPLDSFAFPDRSTSNKY